MALAVHSDPSWRPTALVSLAAALFVVFLLLPWGNASFLEAVVTLYARTLDDQQAGAAPDVAATYDHLPDSGWAGFPRGRSPREAASTTGSGGVSGEPSCCGDDHLRGDDGSC
jgi:hypothetical protein